MQESLSRSLFFDKVYRVIIYFCFWFFQLFLQSNCSEKFWKSHRKISMMSSFSVRFTLKVYNKRTPARTIPCQFWEIFEISSRTPRGKILRFYHCSQNIDSISQITLWQLPLRSPTKAIIIWLTKQIKTLYNHWFRAVLYTFAHHAVLYQPFFFMTLCYYHVMYAF